MSAMTTELEIDEAPTALYRCFDAGEGLLYVGISDHLRLRFRKHSKGANWWPLTTRKTVTWYRSRADAAAAEDAAIRSERPAHNVYASDSPRNIKPTEELTDAGRLLRRRRYERALTLAALGAIAGYSGGHLSSVETGDRPASAKCLGALAAALGCEVVDLLPDQKVSAA